MIRTGFPEESKQHRTLKDLMQMQGTDFRLQDTITAVGLVFIVTASNLHILVRRIFEDTLHMSLWNFT